MRFPHPTDYQQAIQNPGLVFQEPELKKSQVKTDPIGMPVVSSGGFALTYCLMSPTGQQWAVRCFHKEVSDRQRRYEAITRFLQSHTSPIFAPVSYISDGILVNGHRYPIIKMPWVEGQTLSRFIEGHITTNPSVIKSLPGQFKQLIEALESINVAHGDLQHGNIMVSRGRLVLVDYDGLYVPALKGWPSAETGHVNYQHPARQYEFGPSLDRFASIVIYLALEALVNRPDLWQKYSTGENLLFQQKDFHAPDSSPLLRDLETIPSLAPLAQRFRTICKCSLDRVPRLVDFLKGQVPPAAPQVSAPLAYRSQYPVIAAANRKALWANVGQRVTVVGQITNYRRRRTSDNLPYIFLNFGDWQAGCLTLVIWPETLQLFEMQRKNPTNYKHKWVSVTGLLVEYPARGRGLKRPQIIIELPSEIEILYGDETEAKQRLGAQAGTPIGWPKASSALSSLMTSTASTISDLYKNWPTGSKPAKPRSNKPAAPSRSSSSTTQKPGGATLLQSRLNVSKKLLDFGKIQAGQGQRQFLEITNAGSGSLHVLVSPLVLWLKVTPARLVCLAGQTKRVTISFKANFNSRELFKAMRQDALELAPSKKKTKRGVEELTIPEAVRLVSNGGAKSISVRVRLSQPPFPKKASGSMRQSLINLVKGWFKC
jgi:serine/threonine protein kinase